MADRKKLESIFRNHGCSDLKWMDPHDTVVSPWVRFKCMFGCGDYGMAAACPPNLPGLDECRALFDAYTEAALFHFAGSVEDPEDRHEWTKKINESLLAVEREVFIEGHYKAFVIYIDPCNICADCVPEKEGCRNPKEARPSLEGLGVDVFATVRKQGYEINVLKSYSEKMNRFGMLLIE